MKRKNHGSRWIVAGAAVAGFAALHLVPRLAVSMPVTAPSAAQAGALLDTDPIENTFAQLNDVPKPDKDTFTIRGRVSVDAGATPVADGVANGVVVTILQSALQKASCGGFTPVDSKAFTASQCTAVEKGRSLYCKDTTDGSFFRLRRSSSPTSFRINTIVRGRNFDPGHPYGIPLAGDVLMTQAHWFGQTEVERCRVTHNGERTACRSKGVSPLPPPCPTPPPPPTPTPPPGPTPTPTPAFDVCPVGCPYTTIAAAVAAASAGDTILLGPGDYLEDTDTIIVDKDLTIEGSTTTKTIAEIQAELDAILVDPVDLQQLYDRYNSLPSAAPASGPSSLAHAPAAAGGPQVISNSFIFGFGPPHVIFVVNNSASVTMRNVWLIGGDGSKSNVAGAIVISPGATLTGSGLLALENKGILGGAIFNGGTLNLNSGELIGNSAFAGGAIFGLGGQVTLGKAGAGDLWIVGNTASQGGGAIAASFAPTLLNVTARTWIADNQAFGGGGGGISTSQSALIQLLDGATVENNIAPAGGGISIGVNDTLVVGGCSGNGACTTDTVLVWKNQAGGIRVLDATAKLTLQGSTGAKVTQNTGTAPGIHSVALLTPPFGVTATRVTGNFDANLTGCNNYYYDNACVIP